ncbi:MULTISPECIES: DUF6279 family lipoprotein [Shewanella]|uniref:DUF6279 family lipoprotein n=2 Tax=Shewanellaceae TaxID=267890 RepID=UPI001676816A|nr:MULTISPECIES: DUF6279 family lipoprotein [Shewanella]MBO1270748.1 lipoprotein [Shewanella sp. 4t3-1-2LB]MCL2904964.1 DUF6279 family lipoprotein [Shewanella fodinae]GGY89616.1 hypothetical protein GCM10007169_03650 [Shewanella fodinae]
MKRFLLLLTALLMLSACSTKMSYHFLDWAIAWQLDDYVSLNKAQEQQFEQALQAFMQWHRQQELPRYSHDLRQLRSALQQHSLTPEFLSRFTDNARQHWLRIFSHTFDNIVPLVASFDDAQVAQIKKQLAKDQQSLQQEYQDKTAEQLLTQADERLQEQLQDWIGRLTPPQKQLIHQYNQQRLDITKLWLDYRHEWYQQLVMALEQRHDPILLRQRLQLLLTTPEQLRSVEYQQQLDTNRQRLGLMLVQVAQHMNAKQQRHIQRKLDDLISDLDDLSGVNG